jgi:hypothetical protein
MMTILCWTTKHDQLFTDYYTVFESINDAKIAYDNLINQQEVYSASLCKPIASTEPHYLEV